MLRLDSRFIRGTIAGLMISLSWSQTLASWTGQWVEKILAGSPLKLKYAGWFATEEELVFLRTIAQNISQATDNKQVHMQSIGVYDAGKFLSIRGEIYYFKKDGNGGFILRHLEGLVDKTSEWARSYMQWKPAKIRRPWSISLTDRIPW